MAEKLSESSVDMIEIDISCPNVKHGGVQFGTSCQSVSHHQGRSAPTAKKKKPLMVKLSNVSDIAEIARAAENEGADALSLINTRRGCGLISALAGPLSGTIPGPFRPGGDAVFPVAVRMVWQTARAVKIPRPGGHGRESPPGRDRMVWR